MGLIKCPECGKDISDKSKVCLNCGYPMEGEENNLFFCQSCNKQNESGVDYCVYCGNRLTPYYHKKRISEEKKIERKNELQNARLIIGIVMIVFSFPVLLQSCAAGMVNLTEQNNSSFDGSIGFLVFLCMITFGIIAISTRKTASYIFLRMMCTVSVVIFLLIFCFYNGIYRDLKIWGYLFAVYSCVFAFSSAAVKNNHN